MPIERDPVLRMLASRRQQNRELSDIPRQIRESEAKCHKELCEIRCKAFAAQRKTWDRYWAKADD